MAVVAKVAAAAAATFERQTSDSKQIEFARALFLASAREHNLHSKRTNSSSL